MNRTIFTTNFGENFVRNTVRIEADASPGLGIEGFRALMGLFTTVNDTPDLLRHGSDCPESIKVSYQAGHWVLESMTIAPRG